MIRRELVEHLLDTLRRFPAVGLVGPRQSGKTTLAHQIATDLAEAAVYVDLELPSGRARLADAEQYLLAHHGKLVVLDEIHRAPKVFETLRGLIDLWRRQGNPAGHYLILGSASIDLLQQSSETLAGRIAYLELTPFTLPEVSNEGADAMDRLWLRGGFPNSFLADSDRSSMEWRRAFLRTYLERDVPMFSPRVPAETLGRFWQMLAHNQSQMLNAANLAAAMGLSGQTIARYLDTLVDLLLVRRLQPWAGNLSKRLVKSPKVYIRDSGVAHALLGLGDREQLLGHPVAGASWEGFAIENILAHAPAGTRSAFYRTSAGAEIDLVLEIEGVGLWAIEIKRSLSPSPGKGFQIACDDVNASRRVVIYPGGESYKINALTEVVPLATFLKAGFGAKKPDAVKHSKTPASRASSRRT